jgi:hypothetical protein
VEALLFVFDLTVTTLFLLAVRRINKGTRDDLGMFAFRREEESVPPESSSRTRS